MMTYLRYWAVPVCILVFLGLCFSLPNFANKWSHVVVGFMVLPLLWAMHYVQKQRLHPRRLQFWVLAFAFVGFASAIMAPNPYAALVSWFSLLAGLVIFQVARSLTPEHWRILYVGIVALCSIGVGYVLVATKTALVLPWVPTFGKDPVALAVFAALPLLCGAWCLQKQAWWKNSVLALACLLCSLPFALPSFWHAVGQQWRTTQQLAQPSLAMLQERPIFGIGLDNYATSFTAHALDARHYPYVAPSATTEILVSLGLLGGIVGLVLFAMVLHSAWKRYTGVKRYLAVGSGFLVLVLGVFANTWQYPATFMVFWLVLGFITQPLPTQESSTGTSRRARSIALGLGAMVALQSLVMGLGLNRFAAAERAARAGDTKTAAELYALSLRYDPDPTLRRAYAEALWLNGHQTNDLAAAESHARMAYDWNRDDAFSRQVAARIAFSAERYADAERLYREALARDPWFSLDAYLAFADVYKKQKKTAEEKQLLEEVMARFTPAIRERGYAFPGMPGALERIEKRLKELR